MQVGKSLQSPPFHHFVSISSYLHVAKPLQSSHSRRLVSSYLHVTKQLQSPNSPLICTWPNHCNLLTLVTSSSSPHICKSSNHCNLKKRARTKNSSSLHLNATWSLLYTSAPRNPLSSDRPGTAFYSETEWESELTFFISITDTESEP